MSDAQIAGGHKAALNNPNVSKEAKEHSKKVLKEEFDEGNVPKASEDTTGKNPGNVAGGLKATVNNPKTSQEAKENAKERLEGMGQ